MSKVIIFDLSKVFFSASFQQLNKYQLLQKCRTLRKMPRRKPVRSHVKYKTNEIILLIHAIYNKKLFRAKQLFNFYKHYFATKQTLQRCTRIVHLFFKYNIINHFYFFHFGNNISFSEQLFQKYNIYYKY